MNAFKEITVGLIIVILITVISYMLSLVHPSFDSLVISIIFGMLVANIIKDREIFEKGIAFALKLFLPLGIALYGAQLQFEGARLKLWIYVILTLVMLFALTYFISRVLGLSKTVGILLSTGISICGASAIAVIAPLIKARKEEISISIIVVMLVGLAGMISYPLISDFLVLKDGEFAFLSGATLPMLGQVKAVALTAGQDSLETALKLKLIRISCLIFIPIAALALLGRENKFYIPWFILVFIALAIGVNLTEKAKIIKELTQPVSKFFLSAALAAIGLSVDFDAIAEEGAKPLFTVCLSWGIVVLLIYLIFGIENV